MALGLVRWLFILSLVTTAAGGVFLLASEDGGRRGGSGAPASRLDCEMRGGSEREVEEFLTTCLASPFALGGLAGTSIEACTVRARELFCGR